LSSFNKAYMITVVGGTYYEYCFEPNWRERFGSGLRGCFAINSLSDTEKIKFHTFCDEASSKFFEQLPLIEAFPIKINDSITFSYDHPLRNPEISPRLDKIERTKNHLKVKGENVLFYGFLEGFATVEGDKVVYDPQSPLNPISFSATGSKANSLTYIVNITEARNLSKKTKISDIKDFFINSEKANVLVIKMGAKGALVIDNSGSETLIPVYKTNYVWPIGSGDVFAAVYAYYWFKNGNAVAAANQASWSTACYCNSISFQFPEIANEKRIAPLHIKDYPRGQVYLAAPFFTFAERWLVEQIREALIGLKIKVFSPLHDIGHGVAGEVVSKDLDAINQSSAVFAIVDGLDSGTLFEIGYATKLAIPIIAYVENETPESIKMLEGTGCILEKDMTTALYKCFWALSESQNA
jgi:nucleoside 2-deoxyribosyltransferase